MTPLEIPKKPVAVLAPFTYGKVSQDRETQIQHTICLNYCTSRLRAALFYWTVHGLEEASGWWLQGLKNEMVLHNYLLLKNII
jgi:hypothetical protein